ncbi:MAG: hypothetical protein ACLF0G_16145 [Candidatus Brocadiia bacterium]
MWRFLRRCLALAVFLSGPASAAEPPLERAGIEAGLAVHLGADASGALERRLAATGR